MWAFEDDLVKRGSTLISFAPRAIASVIHLKDMGWFSAALEPIIMMRSAFLKSM
jgi:hypothetical protein